MLRNNDIGSYEDDDGYYGWHHHSDMEIDVNPEFFLGSASFDAWELVATVVHEARHHFGENHGVGETFEDDYMCQEQLNNN